MQAIGVILLVAGIVMIVFAWQRGRAEGTTVTDGPPPPRPARTLMASGILAVLVGLALTAMASV